MLRSTGASPCFQWSTSAKITPRAEPHLLHFFILDPWASSRAYTQPQGASSSGSFPRKLNDRSNCASMDGLPCMQGLLPRNFVLLSDSLYEHGGPSHYFGVIPYLHCGNLQQTSTHAFGWIERPWLSARLTEVYHMNCISPSLSPVLHLLTL